MPVSAGVESIFFTMAGVGLCFGFVLNTVMIIEQSLDRANAFSAVHAAMLVRRLEVLEMLGGDTARTRDPN